MKFHASDRRVLLIAKPDEPLASLAIASLAGHHIRRADDPTAAAGLLAGHAWLPDVIVLVASRPGEHSQAAFDLLRGLVPLARIWRLSGTWCEGEQRSGRPPSGCTSLYWHQWPVRSARELASLEKSANNTLAWPLTATSDERTLWTAETGPAMGAGLIAVCTTQAETAAALADACRSGGYRTLTVSADEHWVADGVSAILLDCKPEQAANAARVRQLKASAQGAPLVAIAGFPREDDCRAALEAGIAAVVSKPFLVHDLLWQLAQFARPNAALAA